MQAGLNIGIGSWIDKQHGSHALPAFPVAAIPFKLRHLSDLSTPEDLARAVELSLLANRMGGTGWMHASGGLTEYLWDRHRNTIADMVTALSTLSPEQRNALARADVVLFKNDGFTISDRFAMYNETRQIHEDLVLQGASVEDVQLAYQNWVTLGHKVAIEEAMAVKTNLSQGTSRLIAASDVTRIDVALDSLGGDVPFAPTLFSPVSAVSTDHWTEAEVDLQALEDAIRPEVSRTEWRRFRGNKKGKVRFRFAVVELHRAWFSSALYEADDWRLVDRNEGVVASGNGREGTLPAFYSRVYMAHFLDVRYETPRPQPRPHTPFSQIAHSNVAVVKPSMMLATQKPVLLSNRPSGVASVLAKRAAPALVRRKSVVAAKPSLASTTMVVRPRFSSYKLSRLEAAPHLKIGAIGRVSVIQKLTTVSVANRLSFTQAQLAAAGSASRPDPAQDRTTYLVGFGRTNMPACPNPNPNYQWP